MTPERRAALRERYAFQSSTAARDILECLDALETSRLTSREAMTIREAIRMIERYAKDEAGGRACVVGELRDILAGTASVDFLALGLSTPGARSASTPKP